MSALLFSLVDEIVKDPKPEKIKEALVKVREERETLQRQMNNLKNIAKSIVDLCPHPKKSSRSIMGRETVTECTTCGREVF